MVWQELSRRGLPPSNGQAAGILAAPVLLWCALVDCDGACEIIGAPEEVKAFEEAIKMDDALIVQAVGVPFNRAHYLIAFDDEAPELLASLGKAIDESGAASGYFVNLEVLGGRLVERLGRPLVRAELGDPLATAGERRRYVRRLMRPSQCGGG